MKTALIVALVGTDSPGIIEKVSRVIREHHGNWSQSHMSRVSGMFTGILTIDVEGNDTQALKTALETVAAANQLSLLIETGNKENRDFKTFSIELLGNDKPGLINEVAHILYREDINVEELSSFTEPAPMSGGQLFKAHIIAQLPQALLSSIESQLSAIANDLMIDIQVKVSDD
ncbi:MAG: ACT domain-containing protein [Pseudomonadota bacterium]